MMGEQTTTCFFRNHLAPVAQAIAVDHFFLLEIMNVGEIFVARQEFSTHCLGYLEVSVGDRILLLHVGDDWKSKEKDWVYGENVKSRQRGWLPKICHVRVAATATAGEIFVARQKFVKVPHCVGYLEVSVGDKILLLHVGDDASSEEKDWIYGEAVQSGQRGWLPKSCYGQLAAPAPVLESARDTSHMKDSLPLIPDFHLSIQHGIRADILHAIGYCIFVC